MFVIDDILLAMLAASPELLAGTAAGTAATAGTAGAMSGAMAAGAPALFGEGLLAAGTGAAGAFGPTAAQAGLLGMASAPSTLGGIAAAGGAPFASGASFLPVAGSPGLLGGFGSGMGKDLMLNGMKMAGQAMSQPQQQPAPQGRAQSPYQGQQQPMAPTNTLEAQRKKRDELLRQMMGIR